MYILLTGSHPFDKFADASDEEVKQTILSIGGAGASGDGDTSSKKANQTALMNNVVFDERITGLSDSCVELMRQLMDPNPETRMTSDKFLRHPWIQGLTASWTTMSKTHEELKVFWQNRFPNLVHQERTRII